MEAARHTADALRAELGEAEIQLAMLEAPVIGARNAYMALCDQLWGEINTAKDRKKAAEEVCYWCERVLGELWGDRAAGLFFERDGGRSPVLPPGGRPSAPPPAGPLVLLPCCERPLREACARLAAAGLPMAVEVVRCTIEQPARDDGALAAGCRTRYGDFAGEGEARFWPSMPRDVPHSARLYDLLREVPLQDMYLRVEFDHRGEPSTWVGTQICLAELVWLVPGASGLGGA
jgi:hypothetical protein